MMVDAQAGVLRRVLLLLAVLAPFGWAAFFAVFRGFPGQDWVVFHTAALLVRTGDLRTLADPLAFTDLLNWTHRAWFVRPLVFHPWVYPPVTLLLALAFGSLPYLLSLSAFLVASTLLVVAALWPWQADRDRTILVAGVLLCPAAAYTFGAGQLSFLVAGVLLGGMALLPAEPFLAGLSLSLLLLKPQFAPMAALALLAARQWRALAGGAVGTAFLLAASLAVAGPRPWTAWLHLVGGSGPSATGLVDAVRRYDQSVHTCLRILGADEAVAGAGQAAAAGLAAACVWLAFAGPAPARQRLVVLLCASVVASPHVGDYDEVMPAAASMLVLLDGRWRAWRPGEPALAAGTWLAGMFAPPALVAMVGVPALTMLSALTPLLPAALMVRTLPTLPCSVKESSPFLKKKTKGLLFVGRRQH